MLFQYFATATLALLCFNSNDVESFKIQSSLKHAVVSGILSGFLSTSFVSDARADVFNAPDGTFSFSYPDEFKISEKMLGVTMKTHDFEVFLKSESTKGLTAGLTVDRVKIDDIRQFATPDELGKRVLDVEIKKDGDWYMIDPITLEKDLRRTRVVKTTELQSPFLSYLLDYEVDSSRGFKHYLVKTVVENKKLYVFTIQCEQDSFSKVEAVSRKVLDSFILNREPL